MLTSRIRREERSGHYLFIIIQFFTTMSSLTIRKIATVGASIALLAGFALPMSAATKPLMMEGKKPDTMKSTKKAESAEMKAAHMAYAAAVKQADMDWKTASKAARTQLKTDLKAATTKDMKKTAQATYTAALKTAKDAHAAAVKTAKDAWMTAKSASTGTTQY